MQNKKTPQPIGRFAGKKRRPTRPMTKKEDVATSPDPKTDEDYPNFPHPPSQEETIRQQRTN